MDDARMRSLWPLSPGEALAEAVALGAVVLSILSAASRGALDALTLAALAVLLYIFMTVFARLNPQTIVKYPLALLAPAERYRLIVGNRALIASVKAEVVGLIATMLATGLDRVPHGTMTAPLAGVLIGFTTVLLATVFAGARTLRPRG